MYTVFTELSEMSELSELSILSELSVLSEEGRTEEPVVLCFI